MHRRLIPYILLIITMVQFTNIVLGTTQDISKIESTKAQLPVLLVYGSQHDLEFGLQIAPDNADITTLNVTQETPISVLNGSSNYDALWWIVSIQNNKTLQNFEDFGWNFKKQGLLIISNHLSQLYYTNSDIIGLHAVNDFKIPENTTKDFILNVNTNTSQYIQNISESLTFDLQTQLSLVIPSSSMTRIANIELHNLPSTSHLESGIYISKDKTKRVAICTFQAPPLVNTSVILQNLLKSKIYDNHQEGTGITLQTFFQYLANYSASGIPAGGDLSFDFDIGSIPLPLIALGGLLGFLALWFLGLGDLIKSLLFAIFTFFLTIIYHLYYVPESRRLTKHDLTTNEVRVDILNFLEQKGAVGGHLREIQRNVNCGISSLLWHLQLLEDFDFVKKRKVGRYHIYTLADLDLNKKQKALSKALRSEIARNIWEVLNNSNEPLKLSDIAKEIDSHHETVRYHLKRFVDLELVNTIQKGKRTFYSSKEVEMHPTPSM